MATVLEFEKFAADQAAAMKATYDAEKAAREKLTAEHAEYKAAADKRMAELEAQAANWKRAEADAHKASIPGLEYAENGEQGKFSLWRAYQLAASQGKNSRLSNLWDEKEYGLEVEAIREQSTHKQYAQTAQDFPSGGIFVPQVVQRDAIIPLLQNEAVMAQLGITIMSGMVGTIEWPTNTATYTAYYVDSESMEAVTSSKATFGSRMARPYLMGAKTKLSWGMLTQTGGAMEAFARAELVRQLALKMDKSAIHGTGVDQPLGLKLTPNIGTQSWSGANYTSAVTQTATDFLNDMYWKLPVAKYTGSGSLRYAGQAEVGQKLSKIKGAEGTSLWNGVGDNYIPASFNAVPFVFAPQMAAPTNDITTAEVFSGDWTQLYNLMWQGMTLRAVEENDDASRARITMLVHAAHDCFVREPKAFVQATAMNVT